MLSGRRKIREFLNRYAGSPCWIIGRGPTLFDYQKLSTITEPVGFINDAVQLESLLPAGTDSFFFALDNALRCYITPELRSLAVVPVGNGTQFCDTASRNNVIVLGYQKIQGEPRLSPNPAAARERLAQSNALYFSIGTISIALCFFWVCGCNKVNFVGCDGIQQTSYDSRLKNKSGTHPGRHYDKILKTQKRLCGLFGFDAVYHGTPCLPTS